MLMERVPGEKLSTMWSSITAEQHFAIARSLIEIERKLVSNALSRYGNIYYRHDCPENVDKNDVSSILREGSVDTSDYVLGPVSEHSFWSEQTAKLDMDRGPCKRLGRKTVYRH